MRAISILAAIAPVAVVVDAVPTARQVKSLAFTNGALRMNQVQVVGSHNSYHVEAPKKERDLQGIVPSSIDLQYSHAALDVQFESQKVRSIELDLMADPNGGNYKEPFIRKIAGLGKLDTPEFKAKGTKVMHIPDVDYHSTCNTLVTCLQVVKKWLDANPNSIPIPILLEYSTAQDLAAIVGAKVIKWNEGLLDNVDAEIRSVFPPEQIITPDNIRQEGLTLEQSILQRGWPDLDSARGRVFFLMDNGGDIRTAYTKNRPNLEGRISFTNAPQGSADCAFQKKNDPTTEANVADIQAAVKAGYWVRTRADIPLETVIKKKCDTSMRDAALRSGAQVVSSDFPAWGMSARYGCDYAVTMQGKSGRCNPVNGPQNCDTSQF